MNKQNTLDLTKKAAGATAILMYQFTFLKNTSLQTDKIQPINLFKHFKWLFSDATSKKL